MDSISQWAASFLALAFISGFFLGRLIHRSPPRENPSPCVQPHYLTGLNYLLSERQDAAIDAFIDSLEVNSETLETHLALGNFLRKRGESDRAIKIHQNLLSRSELDDSQQLHVQLELARDFIAAGLLDRAELLLKELISCKEAGIRFECLEHLVEIYQDEKEWANAIDVIKQVAGRRFIRMSERWRLLQSHFYCELAEIALAASNFTGARNQLKAALVADRHSARAFCIMGRLELTLKNYSSAIQCFKQMVDMDDSLLGEVLPDIERCYREIGEPAEYRNYLVDLLEKGRKTPVVLAMAKFLALEEGSSSAQAFLLSLGEESHNVNTLRILMLYLLERPEADDVELAEIAGTVLKKVERGASGYRCGHCGFSGQHMHWLCPSCKSWDSVRPVVD